MIIPYWDETFLSGRNPGQHDAAVEDCYEAGIFTEFMEQRGPGHTVGSVKIYEKGFLDYKEDIQKALDALDFQNDPEAFEKQNQLRGMSIACDAVMVLERDMQNTQENLRRKRPTKRERQSFYRSQPTVTWYRLTSRRHSGRQSRCTGSYI